MKWFNRIFRTKAHLRRLAIKEAVRAVIEKRGGRELLRLIVTGEVKWVGGLFMSVSTDGHLIVENDRYFYLNVRWGWSTYSISNLVSPEMASMLECASVNAAKIGRAVVNYPEDGIVK